MSVTRTRLVTLVLGFAMALPTFRAATEDIDIFSIDDDRSSDKPNVLIVLDNTSNWSRQSQQWPGGLTQGQSEARAIKNVIDELDDGSVNLGLMEYITEGNATVDGGYLRYHIRPMTGDVDDPSTNKGAIAARLDTIFNNINTPAEKLNQGGSIGTLMFDAFNYLGGLKQSYDGAGTPTSLVDTAAYASNYDTFRSPLTATDSCRRTVIVFIGNNAQSGPAKDDTPSETPIDALEALGGDTTEIPFAEYRVTSQAVTYSLGTSSCYATQAACNTAVSEASVCADEGFSSCSCGSTATACPLSHFTVFGRTTTQTTVSGPTTETEPDQATGEFAPCQNNSPGTYTCPSPSTTYTAGPGANQTTQTTVSWSGCSYVEEENACGNNNNKSEWTPTGTRTTTTTITETTLTDVELGPSTSCSDDVSGCSTAAYAACSDGTYSSCFCSTPTDTTGCGAGSTFRYPVTGATTTSSADATGVYVTPSGGPWVSDEWARYLSTVGVPLPGSTVTYDANGYPVVDPDATRVPVTTFTIDVFNAQQNADFSGLLFNMARVSGGRYYQAKDEDDITAALKEILSEVQAVNTAFSSASLPVSATNRAQNENQVFIGLFRPDKDQNPLWFGNLKRYQVIRDNTELELGDADGNPAINSLTGFIGECARSYWTVDSGAYWNTVGTDDPDAKSICETSTNSPWSDSPDGPFVEKGAAAEVLRRGNVTGTADADGNFPVERNMKTLVGGALADFNTTNVSGADIGEADSTVAENIVNFIRGEDIKDEDNDSPGGASRALTEPRSTIHGDVIHSRPLPVNYDGSIVVYYGTNDGTFRAVAASTGQELWSFVAPEHFGKLPRLFNNSQKVRFFLDDTGAPKDYFFDGSIGLYQNTTDSQIWIYPSMRRGGRKVYAFDVTTATSPGFKWSVGCDDSGSCDSGFETIGQTWSRPSPAFVTRGDSSASPVVIFGGGYDACEDEHGDATDSPTKLPTNCASPTGTGVYVVDGDDGELLQHVIPTTRSVAADVSFVDVNFDDKVDFGYAADTGGGVYRIDLQTSPYSITKVGQVDSTSGRKFLFAPALLQTRTDDGGEVVVYVAIGSGDRERPLRGQYPYRTDVLNRFYVFKDYPTRTYTEDEPFTTVDLDGATMRDKSTPDGAGTCDTEKVLPDDEKDGWYVDLDDHAPNADGKNGEQVVTSAVIAAGKVFFSTNQPEAAADSELSCTTSLGIARGYALDIVSGLGRLGKEGACGTRSDEFTGGGLPPPPVIAEVPVCAEGQTSNCDVETICIGCISEDCGSGSPLEACTLAISISSIRKPLYWYTEGDTE